LHEPLHWNLIFAGLGLDHWKPHSFSRFLPLAGNENKICGTRICGRSMVMADCALRRLLGRGPRWLSQARNRP
jgi:hypothetical protein